MNLAERMKRYEHGYRAYLPRRTYTLIRLDGKAFHSYTRECERPFDAELARAMDESAAELCREITGTQFAYVQSDEISLLVTDFQSLTTEPWMAGNVAKVTSVSASVVTAAFNACMISEFRRDRVALFDSRVWTIADPNEVGNYFIWRQRDAIKNSITMAAQSVFSHRDLDRMNSAERKEKLLQETGINWDTAYSDGFKRGRVVFKENYLHDDGETWRTRWVTEDAPLLSLNEMTWLNEHIPRMPNLPVAMA